MCVCVCTRVCFESNNSLQNFALIQQKAPSVVKVLLFCSIWLPQSSFRSVFSRCVAAAVCFPCYRQVQAFPCRKVSVGTLTRATISQCVLGTQSHALRSLHTFCLGRIEKVYSPCLDRESHPHQLLSLDIQQRFSL